jgi:hypothetical protein
MIDYNTKTKQYAMDGELKTRADAMALLRAEGLSQQEAASILRIYRLSAEIEARLPLPPPDLITDEEAVRLICALICSGLQRAVGIYAARRWVDEHLRPARRAHTRGCYSWKHEFEWDTRIRYIRSGDFAGVLTDAKIRVDGNRVYCKEIRR